MYGKAKRQAGLCRELGSEPSLHLTIIYRRIEELKPDPTGRRCRGLELDPAYVDTIVRRWQAVTGGTARHVASSRNFVDLAREVEVANAP